MSLRRGLLYTATGSTAFSFRTLDLGLTVPAGLVARDGSQLIYHQGKLHMIGGWNPAHFSSTNDSTNQHWVNPTPDNPATWTRLADAPFSGVHWFGCASKDGFIWKWGNDTQNPGKTSYKYSEATGWVLVSSEMTGDWGDRYVAGYCEHKGYFYTVGGVSTLLGPYYYDVIRSNDCVNWTTVGTLPVGNYLAPVVVSDGFNLYVWGGGSYLSVSVNDAILKSVDDGANWTNIGTLPSALRGTYQGGAYFRGKFWHLNGFNSAVNQIGLYYTSDFSSWTRLYDNPIATHASGFGQSPTKLYRFTGNLDNFIYSLYSIPKPSNAIASAAAAIYSVRNNSAFSGNYSMEVVNSSGATADIGFNGNDINEAAMNEHMGSGDLFVSKWYDRSGNSNNATNIAGSRPRVGTSGALHKVNGKVAVYHPSGSVRLLFDSPISLGTQHTVFAVINFTESNREFIGAGGNVYMVFQGFFNGGGALAEGFSTVPNSQQLLTDFRSERILTRFLNSQAATNSRPISSNNSFTPTNLSGESDPNYNFIGYMQEVIIYAGDKLEAKSGIEQNINQYYSIY